jgi:hypothetical protein
LTLADEEMKTIVALDEGLLSEHQHKLWLYFAKRDDWVGDGREEIIQAFHPDHEAVQVVHGEPDIPHAFCISKRGVWFAELHVQLKILKTADHGDVLAQQSFAWLKEGGFLWMAVAVLS